MQVKRRAVVMMLKFDMAAMFFDDLLGHGEAKARAALLGGEERLEDMFDRAGRNAACVVSNHDDGIVCVALE